MGRCSVVFPVCKVVSVEVIDNFIIVTTEDHFGMFGSVIIPYVIVEFIHFVVNEFVNV